MSLRTQPAGCHGAKRENKRNGEGAGLVGGGPNFTNTTSHGGTRNQESCVFIILGSPVTSSPGITAGLLRPPLPLLRSTSGSLSSELGCPPVTPSHRAQGQRTATAVPALRYLSHLPKHPALPWYLPDSSIPLSIANVTRSGQVLGWALLWKQKTGPADGLHSPGRGACALEPSRGFTF